ncbi:MAG: Na/Pi symporter [Deltaproteobacteria bacterium]|jgi:sodium-dependent phosphate cotransporter|nr:Na/Pi symporter [Deltaproteobacteria bacterium]MBW2530109.1 Na/Pi symporter [Deltaproteobacteria bacterium]
MAPTDIITIPPPRRPEHREASPWLRLVQVLLLLAVFLVGIRGMGTGFKGLGHDLLQSFFHATDNPFVGLVVGILGTTLVQSSSVTTSMIVALVAAPEDPLPVSNAVPMIMGANIGTTVTNTIVSLGHVARSNEFQRAFSAATCHDFFNFISVAVFLPLELATGFLSRTSAVIASAVGAGGPGKLPNPIKSFAKMAVGWIESGIEMVTSSTMAQAIVLIILSAGIIFFALFFLVRILRGLAETRLKVFVSRSVGKSGYIGMIVGIVVTVMVQSSSITTSVMVPLAAAGIMSLEQVFPVAIGANIGTTLTAILASMAVPSETAHLAVQIAFVHLLFNVSGMLLIYPVRAVRRIPLRMSTWLARLASRNKKAAIAYVLTLFYGVPALLIFLSRSL